MQSWPNEMPALIKGVITCLVLFLLQTAASFIRGADLVGASNTFVWVVIIPLVLVCLIKPFTGTVHHVTDKFDWNVLAMMAYPCADKLNNMISGKSTKMLINKGF